MDFNAEFKKRIAAIDATAKKMETAVIKRDVETVIREATLAQQVGQLAAETCEMMILQRMDKAVLIGIKYAARRFNVEESFATAAFAQAIKNNLPSQIIGTLEEALI